MEGPNKIVQLLNEEIADMSIGRSVDKSRLNTIIDLIAEQLCNSDYIQEIYGRVESI